MASCASCGKHPLNKNKRTGQFSCRRCGPRNRPASAATVHGISAAPCKSCPYRKDVPSGVWHPEEYAKLTQYDGDMGHQIIAGGTALFLCHQNDNNLCAGWVAAHGPHELIALRLHAHAVAEEVWSYSTPTPVFATGLQAAVHGLRDVERPREDARRVIDRLARSTS